MTSDADGPGKEDAEEKRPHKDESASGHGFFHIYKSGQGYWTRMGTALAAGLIAAITVAFLYQNLHVWLTPAFTPKDATPAQVLAAGSQARNTTIAIIGVLLALFTLFVFWMMNKPKNADFLIATDSEMKKVNWTSRKELIGSTKVVIVFMFLIAVLLFAFDIIFGYFFFAIGVLKQKPF